MYLLILLGFEYGLDSGKYVSILNLMAAIINKISLETMLSFHNAPSPYNLSMLLKYLRFPSKLS